MRREHGSQVDGGHLVGVLVAGGVVQQIQEQLEHAAVGRGQQHEEQLEGLDLPLLVGHVSLVPPLVKQSAFWEKRPTKTQELNPGLPLFCNDTFQALFKDIFRVFPGQK